MFLTHKNLRTKKAFTLIELLVVIAIIGILATVAVISVGNARTKARDAKRVGNAKQIQTALELFFNDNGRYPTVAEFSSGSIQSNTPTGLVTYMLNIPTSPVPADGSCDNVSNQYSYAISSDGSSYTMSYCIGGKTGTLPAGPKCLTRDGVLNVSCGAACSPSCSGLCSGNDGCGGTCPNNCTGNTVCTNSVCVDPNQFVGFNTCEDIGTYYGESYATVYISSKCWMARNLNLGTYVGASHTTAGANGTVGDMDDCVDVSNNGNWSCQGYTGIQKYCYGNVEANCVTDGGLYEWAEMMRLPYHCNNVQYTCNGVTCSTTDFNDCDYPDPNSATKRQGVCPTGWHVPLYSDWSSLENNLGGSTVAGGQLKETGTTHWLSPNTGANNFTGFTALPAGNLPGWSGDGSFSARGYSTDFWSATIVPGGPSARIFNVRYNSASSAFYDSSLNSGYSVRCVQD